MNKEEAKKIVTNSFASQYDEEKFRFFIKNLLPFAEDKNDVFVGQVIPEAYRQYITSYKRVGKYSDDKGEKIDILTVKISSPHTLENARTMQRNFIAHYLKKRSKDAVLVAFYSDNYPDWRFSFVKIDDAFNAEGKLARELTPAKRYSFLVGANEGTHTPEAALLPLLQAKTPLLLSDIEKAFDIEKVTDEFFNQYKKLYLSLRDALNKHLETDKKTKTEFESKMIKTDDFAKRLLGQIVFLYFLQKKGWLGVAKDAQWGTGSKIFLQDLFKQYPQKNYFNDILEPLFYEALATERSNHFYNALNCKIPFLNGGLFEPIRDYDWVNTDILLDNQIFQKIFETFDLYNFTVREDEPLDKEVAVDPEMLGKVFENLIPENERKGSGTFYTPREIVHYMCLESLINYLDTSLNYIKKPIETTRQQTLIPDLVKKDLLTQYQDVYHPIISREILEDFIHKAGSSNENDEVANNKRENNPNYKGNYEHKLHPDIIKHIQKIDDALANIKICDPAIGSGAFPVGILSEIVRLRYALNPYLGDNKRTLYDLKRHTIQESIYGVDIESSAVDIARLRLWLSLVVDEDNFDRIEPLPNLDYKIVVGNSLLGFPYDVSRRRDALRDLTPLKHEYITTHSHKRKKQLQSDINTIIQSEYDNSCKKSLGYKVDFDFKWSFFEVFDSKGGFDVVIGNPPYLEARSKEFTENLKNIYREYLELNWGKSSVNIPKGSDLMMYFYPISIQIMNPKGVGCLITENSWLDTDYGNKFQTFMLDKSYFKSIIDSKYKYFSGKNSPNINTIISVFSHKNTLSDKKIYFVHVNDNIFNVKKSLVLINENSIIDNNIVLKTYNYVDENLKKYKWGFLFRTPEWIFNLMKSISKDKAYEQFIDFGQGLNISSEYVVNTTIIEKLNLSIQDTIPFFRKDSVFSFEKTDNYLIDDKKISKNNLSELVRLGFKSFNLNSTRKVPPIFIMPRGIGRHFCSWNKINAFSHSCVEIYEKKPLLDSQCLAIWAYCNSSLYWLFRELSGRTNLGGGMLKSEASDVAKIAIPISHLEKSYKEIENMFVQMKNREPLNTLEEIYNPQHINLDNIICRALKISEFEEKIREELYNFIQYRQKKSQTH